MKKIIALLSCITLSSIAEEAILLQRIVALEKRVAELEEKLAPVLEEERVKTVAAEQRKLAHERILLDGEFFSRLDLNLIEKAYATGSNDWKSEDGEKALALLLEKYPTANRTGCALLAMAQTKTGAEQIRMLEQVIAGHGSCFYANGVSAGAYARLYLGMRLKRDGKDEDAAKWFDELKTAYPNAIDHKGKLLTSHLEGLQ